MNKSKRLSYTQATENINNSEVAITHPSVSISKISLTYKNNILENQKHPVVDIIGHKKYLSYSYSEESIRKFPKYTIAISIIHTAIVTFLIFNLSFLLIILMLITMAYIGYPGTLLSSLLFWGIFMISISTAIIKYKA